MKRGVKGFRGKGVVAPLPLPPQMTSLIAFLIDYMVAKFLYSSGYFTTHDEGYHIEPAQIPYSSLGSHLTSSSSLPMSFSSTASFHPSTSQVPPMLSSSIRNVTSSLSSSSSSSSPTTTLPEPPSLFSSPSLHLGLHYIFRNSDALPKNVSCGTLVWWLVPTFFYHCCT